MPPPPEAADPAQTPVPEDFQVPAAFFDGMSPPAPPSPAPPPPPSPPVTAPPAPRQATPRTAAPAAPAAPPPTVAGVPLDGGAQAEAPPPLTARPPGQRVRRPIPSRAVLAIGALTLTSLTLFATLVLAHSRLVAGNPLDGRPSTETPVVALAPEPSASPIRVADLAAEAAMASAGAIAAAPAGAVPEAMIARLESAANLPLTGEIETFLQAAHASFGEAAAHLDPALQPYAYRVASRFEWNPDRYLITVSAPNAALAQARTDVLRRVLAPAIASGRLDVRAATGLAALTLGAS